MKKQVSASDLVPKEVKEKVKVPSVPYGYT